MVDCGHVSGGIVWEKIVLDYACSAWDFRGIYSISVDVKCIADLLGRFHTRYHSLAVVLLHKSGTSNTSQVSPSLPIHAQALTCTVSSGQAYLSQPLPHLSWHLESYTCAVFKDGLDGGICPRCPCSCPVSDKTDGYSSSKASSPSPSD